MKEKRLEHIPQNKNTLLLDFDHSPQSSLFTTRQKWLLEDQDQKMSQLKENWLRDIL